MNITDELLMAYADGELDAATRAAVEAVIASDSTLLARVEAHQRLRDELKRAFDPVLAEAVPQQLRDAVDVPLGPERSVVDLHHVRARAQTRAPMSRWSWQQWSAIAASLVCGVIVGRSTLDTGNDVVPHNGRLLAANELADTMERSLSSEQIGKHQVGFSYRSVDGEYCRTFVRTEEPALAGVACRESGRWLVKALTEADSSSAEYRTASSSVPPALRRIVESSISGEPLSVEQEKAAIAAGWK